MDKSDLIRIDKNHLWHPYTQASEYREIDPLVVVRAHGHCLYDADGKAYYDTISSWWCNLLGHNVDRINGAIGRQLDSLDHTLFAGITHQPAVELVSQLLEVVPEQLSRAFFSDNGSTAVEVAIKMSLQYWMMKGLEGRKRFVFLEYGYHGDTIGAMSVSGVSQFNSAFRGLFFDSISIPSPALDLEASISALRDVARRRDICAVIIEPSLQGAGGMLFYRPEFMDELESLRQRYGFHVIVDEIAVGFGRLGRWFAHTESSLRPDFMCMSKSITNGVLPLAITLTTEEVFQEFVGPYSERTFFHGHTFTANPIACSAANALVSILKETDYIEGVKGIEETISELSNARLQDYGFLSNIRNRGVIWRAELEGATREDMFALYKIGLEHGILLRPLGNVIYMFLPINITREELEDIFDRLNGALRVFSNI